MDKDFQKNKKQKQKPETHAVKDFTQLSCKIHLPEYKSMTKFPIAVSEIYIFFLNKWLFLRASQLWTKMEFGSIQEISV